MPRSFLALGPFTPRDRALQGAAEAASGVLRFAATAAELEAVAAEDVSPDAILVHLAAPDLAQITEAVQGTPALQGVPLIAIVPALSLDGALRAASLGADDLLAEDELDHELGGYLALASEAPQLGTPSQQRTVLLADTAPTRGRLLTFLLSQAGFHVVRVGDGVEALRVLEDGDGVDLVVLDHRLPGCEPTSFLALAGERLGETPPGILLVDGEVSSETAAAALESGFRHLYDARRPPDELVFLANEATIRDHGRLRAAPRFPCAVLVRFREEGGRWRHGLSYNVSISGLFVRTIAPPPGNAVVDMELTPPGLAPIAARARVAWRKLFSARADRTVPTGMGLKLCEPGLDVQKAMAVFALQLAARVAGVA
ncbi:MAG TPA: PilZ domain-containing protein [Polyangia bacterium]